MRARAALCCDTTDVVLTPLRQDRAASTKARSGGRLRTV
jgi:hypothetical protein